MYWKCHLDLMENGNAICHVFRDHPHDHHSGNIPQIGDVVSLSPNNFKTFPYIGVITSVKEVVYYLDKNECKAYGTNPFICYTYNVHIEKGI